MLTVEPDEGNRCSLLNLDKGSTQRLTVLASYSLWKISQYQMSGCSIPELYKLTLEFLLSLSGSTNNMGSSVLDRAHSVSWLSDDCIAHMTLSQPFKDCTPFNWSEPTGSWILLSKKKARWRCSRKCFLRCYPRICILDVCVPYIRDWSQTTVQRSLPVNSVTQTSLQDPNHLTQWQPTTQKNELNLECPSKH